MTAFLTVEDSLQLAAGFFNSPNFNSQAVKARMAELDQALQADIAKKEK